MPVVKKEAEKKKDKAKLPTADRFKIPLSGRFWPGDAGGEYPPSKDAHDKANADVERPVRRNGTVQPQ